MKDVEDFIAELPIDEKLILQQLRSILFQIEPRFQERLSYGVPYYYRKRRVCFLWPVSAPLAPKVAGDVKVLLGFCYGSKLSNAHGLLQKQNRKHVYIIPFSRLSSINQQIVQEHIIEAILIDNELHKSNTLK
ncbi:DUF1801 domain-containing protein [Chryseosolibacter indicus]|uniref:DUF1801 domain-containing protein n=1 Tax=Chryseosolibacter indicus TaxID=2782351 RepID=A0ABS5VNS2_9BACT|nr:DUF1801 domain-containing protein [Chryseosolibacter indicus]MBT1703083.1 DUF1801 domain-containing protein [Chryseosolibacter indicus]